MVYSATYHCNGDDIGDDDDDVMSVGSYNSYRSISYTPSPRDDDDVSCVAPIKKLLKKADKNNGGDAPTSKSKSTPFHLLYLFVLSAIVVYSYDSVLEPLGYDSAEVHHNGLLNGPGKYQIGIERKKLSKRQLEKMSKEDKQRKLIVEKRVS